MDTSIVDGLIALPSKLEGEQVKRLFDDLVKSRKTNDLLQDDIKLLRDEITCLKNDFTAYQEKAEMERALDRQRLAKLEKGELQPKQKDHREILLSLVTSRNGKMPEKEARQLMHLSKQGFTNLISAMRDEIEVRQMRTDKRRKLLVLK